MRVLSLDMAFRNIGCAVIIDDKVIYHFGASLKDLGKKWFAFSKFDKGALEVLSRLK